MSTLVNEYCAGITAHRQWFRERLMAFHHALTMIFPAGRPRRLTGTLSSNGRTLTQFPSIGIPNRSRPNEKLEEDPDRRCRSTSVLIASDGEYAGTSHGRLRRQEAGVRDGMAFAPDCPNRCFVPSR